MKLRILTQLLAFVCFISGFSFAGEFGKHVKQEARASYDSLNLEIPRSNSHITIGERQTIDELTTFFSKIRKAKKGTTVVFIDLDNTTMKYDKKTLNMSYKTRKSLFDRNYEIIENYFISNENDNHFSVFENFIYEQEFYKPILTEQGLPDSIKNLRDQGIIVLFLTARPATRQSMDQTYNTLKDLGVESDQRFNDVLKSSVLSSYFDRGIIYTGNSRHKIKFIFDFVTINESNSTNLGHYIIYHCDDSDLEISAFNHANAQGHNFKNSVSIYPIFYPHPSRLQQEIDEQLKIKDEKKWLKEPLLHLDEEFYSNFVEKFIKENDESNSDDSNDITD
jgi:hypothetical protein